MTLYPFCVGMFANFAMFCFLIIAASGTATFQLVLRNIFFMLQNMALTMKQNTQWGAWALEMSLMKSEIFQYFWQFRKIEEIEIFQYFWQFRKIEEIRRPVRKLSGSYNSFNHCPCPMPAHVTEAESAPSAPKQWKSDINVKAGVKTLLVQDHNWQNSRKSIEHSNIKARASVHWG